MSAMRPIRLSRVLGILIAVTLLGTTASAQGYPPLPHKMERVKPGQAGMEMSSAREAALAFLSLQEAAAPSQAKRFEAQNNEAQLSILDPDLVPPPIDYPGRKDRLVNQDFNFRAQNETAIAINPVNPDHVVVGYIDYRLGAPVGGGFGTSFNRGRTWHDGILTLPLLTGLVDFPGFAEPPLATGAPAVAFAADGVVYQSTIGFSASLCENGVFVYRSADSGISWWRPTLSTRRGVVDYWPYAFDCSVSLDKQYMTIDNSGGPHTNRVYVTYTRFLSGASGQFLESPIYLAYSDDGGLSWTVVGEVNGASADLCEFQIDASGGDGPGATGPDDTPYDCDESQYSYPVVGSDGTLYVHFTNEQNSSAWTAGGVTGAATQDFDKQILVVRVNPDTFAVDGPYQVTMLADGVTNYPVSAAAGGRQTICNGGWRLSAAGTLAIGPTDELYVVWADNRNGDEFPFPTFISDVDGSCPVDLRTSTDVFISKSVDGGVTWSNAAKITGDPPDSDNWFPWAAVGDNGWVWVIYYDRRASGNTLADAWVAQSRDGGATWREERISDEASNFRTAFFGGPGFIGDYSGIAVAGDRAYPFWTDSRVPGDSDVYLDFVGLGPR
jgi:hypothetical protein